MDKATAIIKQYEEAVSIKDHWREKFEEAYEYCFIIAVALSITF